jgi:hypothetical protein
MSEKQRGRVALLTARPRRRKRRYSIPTTITEDQELDLAVAGCKFSEVKNCRSSRGSSLNSKFQQQEVLVYRGVRHRSELNKWVTKIRPTAHKRKIWLGTYKSPEEAARAYDVGIHYTGKKIPLNFPESVKNLPELPQGLSWEQLAPFVKKQALTAAK